MRAIQVRTWTRLFNIEKYLYSHTEKSWVENFIQNKKIICSQSEFDHTYFGQDGVPGTFLPQTVWKQFWLNLSIEEIKWWRLSYVDRSTWIAKSDQEAAYCWPLAGWKDPQFLWMVWKETWRFLWLLSRVFRHGTQGEGKVFGSEVQAMITVWRSHLPHSNWSTTTPGDYGIWSQNHGHHDRDCSGLGCERQGLTSCIWTLGKQTV